RTLWPAKIPGPSNLSVLFASVLATYTLPFAGLTTIEYRIVPTCWKKPAAPASWWGGLAIASITNTSLSGNENITRFLRGKPRVLTQSVPFHLTISPTSGAGTPSKLAVGPTTPSGPKPSGIDGSPIVVVWLPVWKPAA